MILRVSLGRGTFPPTMKGSLWTSSKGLDNKWNYSFKELDLGRRKKTSIARFLSELNMKVRDMVELLPYRDLDELVQLCIRVKQQLKRKHSSKSYGFHSYPRKYQAQGILAATPSKPKEDMGKTIEKPTLRLVPKLGLATLNALNVLGKVTFPLNAPQRNDYEALRHL